MKIDWELIGIIILAVLATIAVGAGLISVVLTIIVSVQGRPW